MASLDSSTLNLPQCPVCACLLTDPKTISCSHTFCKSCLITLLSSKDKVASASVVCPLCGSATDVKDGNVSGLPTDESLKSRAQNITHNGVPCEVCTKKKAKAVEYCSDCNKSICITCHKKHDVSKPNTIHKVLNMSDIMTAKVFPKKAVWCRDHTFGPCTEVCITCKKYLCIRCSLTDHDKEGHVAKSVTDYDATFKDDVIRLQKEADCKTSYLWKYIDVVETEKRKSLKHIDAVIKEIESTLRKSVQRIDKNVTILNKKCNDEKEKLNGKFDRIMADNDTSIDVIETAGELVVKSSKVPLDEDTVVIRASLCNELKTVLKCALCLSNVGTTEISSNAKKFAFEKNEELNTMEIGRVQYVAWKLKADVALSTADSMCCMAATSDGLMAVGNIGGNGGIEIYSVGGQVLQIVLKGVCIYGIGFLSDGRCAVRDTGNTNELIINVSLYTHWWEKVDTRFETLSWDEGGHGDLTVDRDDYIYVGYRIAKKIQVFTPAGGKPVREIACGEGEPCQIFAMQCSEKMVVTYYSDSAWVINEIGDAQHKVIKPDVSHVYPAVCKGDTILIAVVNKENGRVTIERYTSELQHMTTLINDHVMQKTERIWYYIQEFTSGEIAFCTPDRLYIFS